jgi:hypothetical protein
MFPPFSIGIFTTELLFLAIFIHIVLIVFFGTRFWIKAFGFASQFAVVLVFFSVALQLAFELVIFLLHKIHLDFGLFELYESSGSGAENLVAIGSLQQPLSVTIMLPCALAILYALEAVVDSCNLENVAIWYMRKEGRFAIVGVMLAGLYFISRCFNHVAHFVIPTTVQMLREEQFEQEMKAELTHALERILLPEAVLFSVWKLLNRLGRTVCGSLLIGIEYVPMWSSQVVSALLEERHVRD